MAQVKHLSLYSETEFESRAPQGFPVSCPTLDLSAIWDASGKNLLVYRPPSQVVSKIHQLTAPGVDAPEVVALTWKPDGQFLAVGWSDGVVRLMGLENNKAAHHIPVCETSEATITHIGWASASITDKTSKAFPNIFKEGSSVEDWASDEAGFPVNLPQELTFFEIDTALPKITPLPAASAGAGEDATVFTIRTGIEFLFRGPTREDYDQVNVMIVGTSDGKLQLSIYDSFVIGAFKCPVPGPSSPSSLVYHASHPHIPTHSLILADKTVERPTDVYLVPMDLPFISSSPINLSLLASKLTTLQKLLRYIKQTQLHMQVEWKNARELPSRFINSIQGDLEVMQSGPRSIVPALFHTIVTGHAYEPLREWLVDRLAERGHKRWDKAVVSGLENLRSLVHENLLPALDRCAIILSRLRGLAQFYDAREDIGFSVVQISRVLDIVSCLNLVGHKILIHVMDELEHFASFSAWLRFQIDRLASSTTPNEDLTEKEATMDNAKVLRYVERYLTGSPLDIFFDEVSKEDYTSDWDHIEDGPSLLHVLDKQLKRHEDGQPSMKALPHIGFLVNYVASSSNKIFKDIAEAKKRSVRFGTPMKLSIGHPISIMDVKMSGDDNNGGIIYTSLASQGTDSKVYIFRASIDIFNGISSNKALMACCVDLHNRKLVDLKMMGPKILLLLCTDADNATAVISIPLGPESLPYEPYDSDMLNDLPVVDSRSYAEYKLNGEQQWRTVCMEVHDKSDVRGEVPARICLLGRNRTTWRSYTIPS